MTVEGAHFLDRQTGENCLLFLVADPGRVQGRRPWRAAEIEEIVAAERRPVRPEEVYDIARALGVAFESLPALVFFTAPERRRQGLQLRLAAFLPAERRPEDLVKAHRAIADALERRASAPLDRRLDLLRDDLNSARERLFGREPEPGLSVETIATTGKTVLESLKLVTDLI
jgi:hypothetical protein